MFSTTSFQTFLVSIFNWFSFIKFSFFSFLIISILNLKNVYTSQTDFKKNFVEHKRSVKIRNLLFNLSISALMLVMATFPFVFASINWSNLFLFSSRIFSLLFRSARCSASCLAIDCSNCIKFWSVSCNVHWALFINYRLSLAQTW